MIAKPEQYRECEFRADRIIRVDEVRFAEHAFQDLRMHFDAGDRRVGRRGFEIEQPDR